MSDKIFEVNVHFQIDAESREDAIVQIADLLDSMAANYPDDSRLGSVIISGADEMWSDEPDPNRSHHTN